MVEFPGTDANRYVRLQQIAIERQQITIANLERQVQRNTELFRNNLVDQETHENLQNDLQLSRIDLRSRREQLSQAQAILAQARDQLGRTEIRSPIDGIAIQVDVKVGETVIAGTDIPHLVLSQLPDAMAQRNLSRFPRAPGRQPVLSERHYTMAYDYNRNPWERARFDRAGSECCRRGED